MPPRQAQLDVVGSEGYRAAFGGPLGQQVAQHLTGFAVQAGFRLVQQQDVGLVQYGAGDGGPLLHTVGEGANPVVGPAAQADSLQRGLHLCFAVADAVEPGVIDQVLAGGEVFVQEAAVADYPDAAPRLACLARQVPSCDTYCP